MIEQVDRFDDIRLSHYAGMTDMDDSQMLEFIRHADKA
jgi:hypothetical protein